MTIYEVLYDTDGEGPTGDGTVIERFTDRGEAARFAAGNTCWGRPADASERDVSRKLARRWGLA